MATASYTTLRDVTKGISRMCLEHILRQIEPDRSNLRHDRSPLWILTDPPWHIDAVGGRSHHQSLIYREYAGGHDYLIWRGALAEGLIALFGADRLE